MDYKKASDLDLWICCQKDDIKAYNELFFRYVAKLHQLGSDFFNDSNVVEELTMDVLLDIWQRRKLITIEKSLSSYIFQAMHFRCLKYLRKKAPLVVDIETVNTEKLGHADGSDYGVRQQEAETAYKELIANLSPQRRRVFELSRQSDMSHAEIAQELNISKNTVVVHMSAALKIFKTALKLLQVFLVLSFWNSL